MYWHILITKLLKIASLYFMPIHTLPISTLISNATHYSPKFYKTPILNFIHRHEEFSPPVFVEKARGNKTPKPQAIWDSHMSRRINHYQGFHDPLLSLPLGAKGTSDEQFFCQWYATETWIALITTHSKCGKMSLGWNLTQQVIESNTKSTQEIEFSDFLRDFSCELVMG